MAEGGFDPTETLPEKQTNPGGDNEEEGDTTGPFQPDAASTPYHNGEQINMHTFPREHSGLPKESGQAETSFIENVDETTPFSRPRTNQQWGLIEASYPDASYNKLDTFLEGDKIMIKMKAKDKAYPLYTKSISTEEERLSPNLPKEIERALGETAVEKIKAEKKRMADKQLVKEAKRQEKNIKRNDGRTTKSASTQPKATISDIIT